jgi:hypothetical protein
MYVDKNSDCPLGKKELCCECNEYDFAKYCGHYRDVNTGETFIVCYDCVRNANEQPEYHCEGALI